MTTEAHRLTDLSIESKTATCQVCGPGTPIRLKRNMGLWQCDIHYREGKYRRARRRVDRQGRQKNLPPEQRTLTQENLLRYLKRFWSKVAVVDDAESCWEWQGKPNPNGYGLFSFAGHRYLAHRVSYIIENGDFDLTLNILHHCDNPLCVRPSHLFKGTHTDNMDDMNEKKRGNPVPGVRRMAILNRGEGNAQSRLTEDDVRGIRRQYVKGQVGCKQALAEQYGISAHYVGDIVQRIRWKHLSDDSARSTEESQEKAHLPV